jgi:hypothetical protein
MILSRYEGLSFRAKRGIDSSKNWEKLWFGVAQRFLCVRENSIVKQTVGSIATIPASEGRASLAPRFSAGESGTNA